MNLTINALGQIVDANGNVVGKTVKAKKAREINENTVSLFYSLKLPDGRDYDGWLTSKDGKNTILKFPSMLVATEEARRFAELLISKGLQVELLELVAGNPMDGLPCNYCEPEISPAQEEVRDSDNNILIQAKPLGIHMQWLPSGSIKKSIERKKTSQLINNI